MLFSKLVLKLVILDIVVDLKINFYGKNGFLASFFLEGKSSPGIIVTRNPN
jgi:hypothetical protein